MTFADRLQEMDEFELRAEMRLLLALEADFGVHGDHRERVERDKELAQAEIDRRLERVESKS